MKTHFQQTLPKDIETLWLIVKMYHPNIPDEAKEKLNTYLHYDWVCINCKVRGYGYINIGIDNACNYTLWGPNISKQDMIKAIENGEVTFRTWRFSMDKLFNRNIPRPKEYEEKQEVLSQASASILKAAGYRLQSPSEMYVIYYED